MQKVKRSFYTYRNGVAADALRKGGSPFKIIFGLDIVTLRGISNNIGYNEILAKQLWHNSSTRCSMLLATMIMPPDNFNFNMALEWCSQVESTEVADLLCMNLLIKQTYIADIVSKLFNCNGLQRYIALRLMLGALKKDIISSSFVSDYVSAIDSYSLTVNEKLIINQIYEILPDVTTI